MNLICISLQVYPFYHLADIQGRNSSKRLLIQKFKRKNDAIHNKPFSSTAAPTFRKSHRYCLRKFNFLSKYNTLSIFKKENQIELLVILHKINLQVIWFNSRYWPVVRYKIAHPENSDISNVHDRKKLDACKIVKKWHGYTNWIYFNRLVFKNDVRNCFIDVINM